MAYRAALRSASRMVGGGVRARGMSVLTDKFLELAPTLQGEVIILQYTNIGGPRGLRWTVKDTQKYASSLASGLREISFIPGESIAVKLPPGRPELHCTLFAAANAGLVVVDIDDSIDDPAVLRSILKENRCKMLIYDEPDIQLLETAIPEYAKHWAVRGTLFYAAGLPDLRFFVTIALDIHHASANYQHMLVYDPFDDYLVPTTDDAALCVKYGANGTRKVYNHADVVDEPSVFPAVAALMNCKLQVFDE